MREQRFKELSARTLSQGTKKGHTSVQQMGHPIYLNVH